MSLEIKIGDRIAQIELLSRQNNIVKVKVDEKIYDIDILLVERGVYSILYNNQSHNIEFCEKGDPKKYTINTYLIALMLRLSMQKQNIFKTENLVPMKVVKMK